MKASLKISSGLKLGLASCATPVTPSGTYVGPYDVLPTLGGLTLETENKYMSDDVTVEPIPIAQASNPAGGYTITIG